LDLPQAVIVGHDWGAPVAWNAALMRPDLFRAVAGLSVPYAPRGPISGLEAMRRAGRHGFYQLRFQAPGEAERALERDVEASFRGLFWSLSGEAPEEARWQPDQPLGGGGPAPQPSWMPADEMAQYVGTFRRTGFRGGLNWYRNIDRNWALTAPWHGARVAVPALFVAGRRDPVLGWTGKAVEALPRTVPNLRGTVLIEAAGHWVQQEAPAEVNAALLGFLRGL
ncbi:alpha/beta fold hydrolase, partial [Paracraurococcus ruber]